MTALIEDFAAIRAARAELSSAGILALVHAERRAEIAARIKSSMAAAAHFRLGE